MLIFTNGCFDIIHSGHVQLLEFCKNIGGKVIVGLNSDTSVKMNKGDSRPINNQEDRKKVLESIRYVDQVIVFEDMTPLKLIEQIKPDIIVKGSDYSEEQVVGNRIAKVILFSYINGKSTTNIINEIKNER